MSTPPTSLVFVCKLRSVLILSERTVSGGGGACSDATPTDDSPSAMHSILAQLTLLVDKAKKRKIRFYNKSRIQTRRVHYSLTGRESLLHSIA